MIKGNYEKLEIAEVDAKGKEQEHTELNSLSPNQKNSTLSLEIATYKIEDNILVKQEPQVNMKIEADDLPKEVAG